MAYDAEKRAALRMLGALEDATLSTEDTRPLYEAADPALVYLLCAWLRSRYGRGHSAAEGVLGRMVALLEASPAVAQAMKVGEQDPIARWFEETYEYRELDRDAFVDLVVDKLEG